MNGNVAVNVCYDKNMNKTQNTRTVSYTITADALRTRHYPEAVIAVICRGEESKRYTETVATDKWVEYDTYIFLEFDAIDIEWGARS